MRTIVNLYQGKIDGELEFYFALSDDGWERDSRLMALIHNLTQTVGTMFGGRGDYKDPEFFNASLVAPAGSPEAIADGDDYPWAEPATEEKEQVNGNETSA